MPATRRRYFLHGADSYQDDRRVDDVETGNLGPNRARFRDVVNATINRKRCQDIKKQLLAGPSRHTFEKFRMSDDELKTIKSKPVRRFYEKQNEKLDDWLEVDTLVLALADDVLDSMHPEDLDHDGVHERGGPLRDTNESIEPFLPQAERDKRIKARRRSRWAININVAANILLLIAKCVAIISSDSLSLLASLVDSALDLLCTLIVWSTNKLVNWRLHKLKRKFPVGRKRLEPIGILVFSVIMVISFIQVAKESIEKLMPHLPTSADPLPTVAVASMVSWTRCPRVARRGEKTDSG